MGALCFVIYNLKMRFLLFLSVLLISSQLEYFSEMCAVYVSQFHQVKESLSTGDRALFSITARTADSRGISAS